MMIGSALMEKGETMRPIDADALIEALNEKGVPYRADVQAELDNAPTIDAMPRWIPCEERLPKDLEVVNITWVNHRPVGYYYEIKDKPFTATAIYYNDKWWWYSPTCEDLLAECGKSECDKMDADIEVTAWMPLPEPYKGEKENQ